MNSGTSITRKGLKACLSEVFKSNPKRISIPKEMTTKGPNTKIEIPRIFIFYHTPQESIFFPGFYSGYAMPCFFSYF